MSIRFVDTEARDHCEAMYNEMWGVGETRRKPKLDSIEELSLPDEYKEEAV